MNFYLLFHNFPFSVILFNIYAWMDFIFLTFRLYLPHFLSNQFCKHPTNDSLGFNDSADVTIKDHQPTRDIVQNWFEVFQLLVVYFSSFFYQHFYWKYSNEIKSIDSNRLVNISSLNTAMEQNQHQASVVLTRHMTKNSIILLSIIFHFLLLYIWQYIYACRYVWFISATNREVSCKLSYKTT